MVDSLESSFVAHFHDVSVRVFFFLLLCEKLGLLFLLKCFSLFLFLKVLGAPLFKLDKFLLLLFIVSLLVPCDDLGADLIGDVSRLVHQLDVVFAGLALLSFTATELEVTLLV